MREKRLLIIGNYPPPFGGVPHHIERLCDYLVANGWKVHVLSGGTSGIERKGNLTIHKPTYVRKLLGWLNSLMTRHLEGWLDGGSLKQERPREWRRYKLLTDVGRDIVKCYGIEIIASYNVLSYAPIGASLAEEFSLPHVVNVFGELYKNEELARRNASFLDNILSRASCILSCSEHCARSVGYIGIDASAHGVTYGINLNHFTSTADGSEKRKKLKIKAGDEVVLFVGRLSREMGLDIFIKAAQALMISRPTVHCLIVGQKEEMFSAAEAFRQEFPGRVSIVTNVPYGELPQYYAIADVVTVPTQGMRTCSSLAAMEAMAVGKPVVASNIGGIPEIVDHGRSGLLFPSDDSVALKDAIERLLQNPVERSLFAEAGYRYAQEQLSEDKVNAKMEHAFLEILRSVV